MSLQNCYGDNNGFKCGWKSCVEKHAGCVGRYNEAQSTQDVIGTVEHERRRKIRTESILDTSQDIGTYSMWDMSQDVTELKHTGCHKIL